MDSAVDSQGRLTIAGIRSSHVNFNLAVIRILSSGKADNDYGIDGTQIDSESLPFSSPVFDTQCGGVYVITKEVSSSETIVRHRGIVVCIYFPDHGRFETSIVSAKLLSTGILDASFGDGGISSIQVPILAVFSAPNWNATGDLFWFGNAQPLRSVNSELDAYIVKLSRNGSIDRTWGTNGVFQRDFTTESKTISRVKLLHQPGGGMTVVTSKPPLDSNEYGKHTSTSLNSSGKVMMDTSFGNFGSSDGLISTALDGGWYVAQMSSMGGSYAITISKYHPDGVMDLGFGAKGHLSILTDRMENLYMRTARDGSSIVGAGNYEVSANPSTSLGVAVAVRVTPQGKLDSRFGSNGVLRFFRATGRLVDILYDESVGTVMIQEELYSKFVASAFDSFGNPILSFGTKGAFRYESPGQWLSGEIDEQGHIVAAILSYSSLPEFKVIQIGKNGALENAFGQNGIATLPVEFNHEFDGFRLTVGKGVIAIAATNSFDNAVVRLVALNYHGNSMRELGLDGWRDYDLASYGESVQDLAIADDGSLWLADALLVIDWINSHIQNGSAEGEFVASENPKNFQPNTLEARNSLFASNWPIEIVEDSIQKKMKRR